MTIRYLLSTVLGTVLVFAWGGAMWAGGAYNRFMHPMPGGDAIVRAMADAAPGSGMYVHPAPIDADAARRMSGVISIVTGPELEAVVTPWVGVLSHLKGLKSAPQHAMSGPPSLIERKAP